MPDSSQPSPLPWRYGELVTFAPAEHWWALYGVTGTEGGHAANRTFRVKVAGWGTYLAGGKIHVIAMVAGDANGEIEPAAADPYYRRLWHDGETICDCGNAGGDVCDPWWCDRCAAAI